MTITTSLDEDANDVFEEDRLLNDQRRAFDIVKWWVDGEINGEKQPQLLMLLHGEGRTGKSKVIQTISDYFAKKNIGNCLFVKTL